MKVPRLRIEDVDYTPDVIEDGILYVAAQYRIAMHNCCCGCGMEVSTPLGKGQYSLIRGSLGPTVFPSIGNHDYPCESHYWIRDGAVIESYVMQRERIELGRAADLKEKLSRRRKPVGCLATFFQFYREK